MTTTPLLDALRRANAMRTLDHAFAQTLRRLDPDTPDTVLAAAALASLAVASGHAGFDPAQPQRLVDADIDWPSPAAWRADLVASRWVSQPDAGDSESAADTPLVFEGAATGTGLLYLRRYREYERRLALGLRRIGAHAPEATDLAALAPLFAQLFPAQRALIPTLLPQAGEGLMPAPEEHTSPVHGRGRAKGAGEGALGANAPLPIQAIPQPNPLPLPAEAPTSAPEEHTSPVHGRGRAAGAGEGAPAQDLQPRAAAIALRHHLVLVTGGPGTGKTTTTARLLVLLVAQARATGQPEPRIALAAPTGRAAERMAESVRNAVQSLTALGIDPALCAPLPVAGTTLHRLLGTIPDSSTFRHHADNPLPFDVVVVDEASMIDLPLMAKLVDAVADGARLVLLGDPDQLPSVEAGDVLSGILRAAGDGTTLDPEDTEALAPLLGTSPNATAADNHTSPVHGRGRAEGVGEGALRTDLQPADPPLFPGRHIHLQRGYRQSASLDLAPLATAVRNGDTATALALLRGDTLAGVRFHENGGDPLQTHRDHLLAHWSALADATDPADALALGNRLRLLTAVRDGPQGARGLNARIEALLSDRGPGNGARRGGDPGYFHGRLLLITENSYRHRLFNGDIGICLRSEANPASAKDDSGAVMAWFPGDDPRHPRPFHPAALPAHDSAFAMTVHKAQGSEFDAVWLVLPDRFNRVLSRELVYTGMTRARRELHVVARADVIADALARHAGRWSGLGWRLGAQRDAPVAATNVVEVPTEQGTLF